MSASHDAVDIQEMVYGRDPLARWVARVTRRSVWRAVLMAAVFQLASCVIPAVLISWYYDGMFPFISVFQKREFVLATIWIAIISQCVFGFYAWQPIGVEMLFTRLRSSGVMPGLSDDEPLSDFLRDCLAKPLNCPWTMVVGVLYVVAVVLLVLVPNWFGAKATPIWWSIHPLYFWTGYSAHHMVGGYVLYWGLIRQAVVVRALYILFERSEVRPKLMHPDGCMGLSAVGSYTFLLCTPVILFGLAWAVRVGLMPIATEKGPDLLATCATCVRIGIYPVFVCAFLVVPAIAPHRALRKAREEALEKIAVQIRERLRDADSNPTPSNTEALNALEHRYAMVYENFTTWPFRAHVMRNFCIVAVLPLLPTVVPMVIDLLKSARK